VSHCAPDEPEDAPPTKLTCPQLRAALRELNLDTRGTKPVLVARLEAARRWEGDNPAAQGSAAVPLVSEAAPVKSEPFETPSRGNKRRTQRADSNSSSADELDTAEERLAAALSGAGWCTADSPAGWLH
jgi:SAP domain